MSGPTAIPKFASFKPKPAPPPEVEEHRKPGTGNQKDVRHRPRQAESRDKSGKDISPPRETALWVVDRKGDVKNLVYGTVHKYSVPPFHRAGQGAVLGAPPSLKIDRDAGDEKSIVLARRGDSKLVSREKYVFSKTERERPRLLKIRPELLIEEHPTDRELDFVSLTPRGKKRKRADAGDSGSENEIDYRSIHGKQKSKDQPADEVLQYATESETSGSERHIKLDTFVNEKSIKLSRRVEEYPHDIDAWLALIEHQNTLISYHGRKRITNAEIRSTADIKIHMYEKALRKASSLQDRERLLLGLMAEGSKVWEIKAQADRWERISKENIDSLVLWRNYANFKQSTFSTFRQEEVRDVFTKRIALLMKAINAAKPDAIDALYTQLLYVLVRFTIFTRESGYSELATAIWQGLLEFNFFAPSSFVSHTEKVTSFNDFWESELPRIGEDGALGWRHFAENSDTSEPGVSLTDEAEATLDIQNLFTSWARAERSRSNAALIPARTLDEVVEDDPFRVILVSDIEEFLISLPQSMSLRKSLIDAFLLFCNQPPLTTGGKGTWEALSDSFTQGELLEADTIWIRRIYLSTPQDPNVERDADMSHILNTPSPNFSSSPDSRFGISWFKSLPVWRDTHAGYNGPVVYKWLRNSVKQLLQVHAEEDLAEYHLAFEWRNEPEAIKKTSKSLLKQHPSSLRLYNSYAMIEWSRGNKDVARGVYLAALNMSKSMPENECKDSITLWRSWTWASLEDSDYDTALSRLLSIASYNLGDPIRLTPAVLLKTKEHLSSSRDFFTSSSDISHAAIYAECQALLEYLSATSATETQSGNQGNIAAALSIYTEFSQALIDRNLSTTAPHELLLQSAARLLYHHARVGPFRPALIREHLTRFLGLFPRNTIFLSLYAFNESRLRIDNRVRSILLSNVLTPENDTPTSRLFAIHYEMNHGTIHSVRSAFENAVSSTSSQSSAGIWRLYILYCLQTPQFRPRIKDVWHRALRACPWAKELYVLGFEKLDGLVEFGELKSTWRVMEEKELRVHVSLDDSFDDLDELARLKG